MRQGIDLLLHRNVKGALQLASMIAQGHAVWFTGGTPAEVEKQVRKTMQAAAFQHRVPFSSRTTCRSATAGSNRPAGRRHRRVPRLDRRLAKGIGSGKAVVILEPDGLGSSRTTSTCRECTSGASLRAARPRSPTRGYVQMNAAVDRLAQQPRASVYLDGTHSSWLGSGEAAYRLVKGGASAPRVLRQRLELPADTAARPVRHLDLEVHRLRDERAFLGGGALRLVREPVLPRDLERLLDVAPDGREVRGGGGPEHRRGRADALRRRHEPERPRAVAADGPRTPDAQDWCNPPGRGLGARQTANTGAPAALGQQLVDAYLWIKVPGESDGSCNRGIAGSTIDPEWGLVDPPAGARSPQQALQLAQLASPPLFR